MENWKIDSKCKYCISAKETKWEEQINTAAEIVSVHPRNSILHVEKILKKTNDSINKYKHINKYK